MIPYIRIYIGILLVYTCFCFPVEAEDVGSILSTIPHDEREELNVLFSKLVFLDQFVYTLIGGKAVSLSGSINEVSWEKIATGSRSGRLFWKKWDTWNKYSSRFSSQSFLLFKEKSTYLEDASLIILINKAVFIETFEKYRHIFEEILGEKTSPKAFLEKLESGSNTFQSLLMGNEILLGILLGFGEHNARLYARRDELNRVRGFSKLMLKEIKPSQRFATIEKENEYLSRHLQSFDNQSDLLFFNSINFAADHSHEETRELLKKYRKMNEEITKIYKNNDVLEVTLSLLTK